MKGPVWLCSMCPQYFETDVQCLVHEKMHELDNNTKMRPRPKDVKICPGCKGEGILEVSMTICPLCKGKKFLREKEQIIKTYEPIE